MIGFCVLIVDLGWLLWCFVWLTCVLLFYFAGWVCWFVFMFVLNCCCGVLLYFGVIYFLFGVLCLLRWILAYLKMIGCLSLVGVGLCLLVYYCRFVVWWWFVVVVRCCLLLIVWVVFICLGFSCICFVCVLILLCAEFWFVRFDWFGWTWFVLF